jgi:glycosyltransferase involved in cell wall biosynthesis
MLISRLPPIMPDPAPDISIVVTTFDGERFLREQLDSILAQTVPPGEIVVVDDGSRDGTMAILEAYAAADPRFRIFRNEENLGYVRNFEKGMRLATGALVALSDQDDVWLPHKLATLHSRLGDGLIVYSDSELVDEEGRRLGRRMSDVMNQIGYDNCLMYAVGAWAPGHAMLFRRELVELCLPFPTLVTHDFWLGFTATCHGAIRYVDEPLVLYRQHRGNAIGAGTGARKAGRPRPTRAEKLARIRARMSLLYERCPAGNRQGKEIYRVIHESYRSFSPRNDWIRMVTFLRYRHLILAYKKKSAAMKVLFCLKMFFAID